MGEIEGAMRKIRALCLVLLLVALGTASANQPNVSNQSTSGKSNRLTTQSQEVRLDQPCGKVGDLTQDGRLSLVDVILYAKGIFGDNSIIRNLTPKCVLDTNSDGYLLSLADLVFLARSILNGLPLPQETCCD